MTSVGHTSEDKAALAVWSFSSIYFSVCVCTCFIISCAIQTKQRILCFYVCVRSCLVNKEAKYGNLRRLFSPFFVCSFSLSNLGFIILWYLFYLLSLLIRPPAYLPCFIAFLLFLIICSLGGGPVQINLLSIRRHENCGWLYWNSYYFMPYWNYTAQILKQLVVSYVLIMFPVN